MRLAAHERCAALLIIDMPLLPLLPLSFRYAIIAIGLSMSRDHACPRVPLHFHHCHDLSHHARRLHITQHRSPTRSILRRHPDTTPLHFIIERLLLAISFIFAITPHEFSHIFAAIR
jgi:hypothetical protein